MKRRRGIWWIGWAGVKVPIQTLLFFPMLFLQRNVSGYRVEGYFFSLLNKANRFFIISWFIDSSCSQYTVAVTVWSSSNYSECMIPEGSHHAQREVKDGRGVGRKPLSFSYRHPLLISSYNSSEKKVDFMTRQKWRADGSTLIDLPLRLRQFIKNLISFRDHCRPWTANIQWWFLKCLRTMRIHNRLLGIII